MCTGYLKLCFVDIYIAIANLKNVNCNLHTLQLQDNQNNKWCVSQSNSKKNTAEHTIINHHLTTQRTILYVPTCRPIDYDRGFHGELLKR